MIIKYITLLISSFKTLENTNDHTFFYIFIERDIFSTYSSNNIYITISGPKHGINGTNEKTLTCVPNIVY